MAFSINDILRMVSKNKWVWIVAPVLCGVIMFGWAKYSSEKHATYTARVQMSVATSISDKDVEDLADAANKSVNYDLAMVKTIGDLVKSDLVVTTSLKNVFGYDYFNDIQLAEELKKVTDGTTVTMNADSTGKSSIIGITYNGTSEKETVSLVNELSKEVKKQTESIWGIDNVHVLMKANTATKATTSVSKMVIAGIFVGVAVAGSVTLVRKNK